MDQPPTVAAGFRRLTVNLDEEDVELFENLWPIPHGVALHAWLLQGHRSVIVDPWDAGGYGPDEVEVDLGTLGLSWKDIAAVAFTKAPAGNLVERLRQHNPSLEVWGTPEPGVRHDLGAGVELQERGGFWFVSPVGAALTGDAFAGLGWIEDEVWTEDLGEHQGRHLDDEALRWFASRPLVPELPPGTLLVAPAHGCLTRDPGAALARARKFESWAHGPALEEVTVVWPAGPAHEAAVDAFVGGVLDVGAGLNLFRVPGDDPTTLAAGARRASLVVVAAGLDVAFLGSLEKEVWRPETSAPAAGLRVELARRYGEPA